jgi:diguanylate cyclase (GGDEF)-like protein/PAS domain S-box-containing protein
MKLLYDLEVLMLDLQNPEVLRTVLDSLQTGVWVADRSGKILFWNQGAERITGFMRHDVMGRFSRDNILVHCNDQGCVDCAASCPFSLVLHDGRPREARMRLRHREGQPVPSLMWIAPIRDSHGSVIGLAASFEEQRLSTDRDRRQQSLAASGCLDEATGVANQEFTQFRLRESLASLAQYHLPFGVILIQVDRLGDFRASYGRQAGDAVVRVVAQTVRDGLRPSDLVGRWSQDQFLAILTDCGSSGVEKTAERIHKVVACAGLRWWGDDLTVTTSVGFGVAQGGDTIESLLKRAQNALRPSADKQAATLLPAKTGVASAKI